jgi:hypothetical protein
MLPLERIPKLPYPLWSTSMVPFKYTVAILKAAIIRFNWEPLLCDFSSTLHQALSQSFTTLRQPAI